MGCSIIERIGMREFFWDLRAHPSPRNCGLAATMLAGGAGAIAGLVVGLHVHVATAWAAMFEIGIPAAVAGGMTGFLVGCVLAVARRHGRVD
jgi:hypothetical protein